jgi:hypothetical protein
MNGATRSGTMFNVFAVATCFIFSKEGRDMSKDIADDLWEGLVK